ncbi:MAG: RNA-protein complex protein Nop10 [Candidatus Lokiarchaeota archaeon]|nr:RNA-protein complex protein Nop10 [Candidatus Lokiarchaeota archaeon]
MPKMLHYCPKCEEYTLSINICSRCGSKVKNPHPPKFSPQDKYQKYRIPLFKEKIQKD